MSLLSRRIQTVQRLGLRFASVGPRRQRFPTPPHAFQTITRCSSAACASSHDVGPALLRRHQRLPTPPTHLTFQTTLCNCSLFPSTLTSNTMPNRITTRASSSLDNDAPPCPSPHIKGQSTVTMIDSITAAHTIDGSSSSPMDIQPLLRLMDICTCASAEKHTKVNCVTASVGDIVFEYMPTCGELLELTATPVYTSGRTSLDIGLNVVSEGDGGVRRFVCYASFTYVTTSDEDGNKTMCPPLCHTMPGNGGNGNDDEGDDDDVPDSVRWERTVAFYRRALVKAERKKSTTMISSTSAEQTTTAAGGAHSGFDLEFTEVVLPAHQNHMQHTFGGIVMGWMCKAALAEASRKSKRNVGALRIRSVMRIDFREGSDVSDHIVFRPRLNAVFDDAKSADVEVRVSRRCIETGLETQMNTGYFYISGLEVDDDKRPFAKSLEFISQGEVGGKENMIREQVRTDATWRRRLLLARRRLLGGLGESIEWHPALQDEAPVLTILAVLRLVQHSDASVKWDHLLHEDDNGAMTRLNRSVILGKPKVANFQIECTRCEWLGSKNTFILRAKGSILNVTVKTLFELIKDQRPQWDKICTSVEPIEEKSTPNNDANDDDEDEVCWDIVQHTAIMPAKAMLLGYLTSWWTRSLPHREIPMCLLRAWKTSDNGDTIIASRSINHPKSAQDSLNEVLPSGWFLSPLDDAYAGMPGVSVTYVGEHDLRYLRKLAPMLTDEGIIDLTAKNVKSNFLMFETIAAKLNPAGNGSID